MYGFYLRDFQAGGFCKRDQYEHGACSGVIDRRKAITEFVFNLPLHSQYKLYAPDFTIQ